MNKNEHIIISLEARHAENILCGHKQVELRRRTMNVTPGTIIWMYAKLPVGSIVGKVRIFDVYESSPKALWRRFGSVSGVSRSEFFEYFDGSDEGVALVLENAERLRCSLSLEFLREFLDGFHPPQFYSLLTNQKLIRKLSYAV